MQSKEFCTRLHQEGFRLTGPRKAILRVMTEAEDWLCPEEVQRRGRGYWPSLGLVTVYRTLSLVSDMDLIRRVHLDDGCHGYILASPGHYHAIVCQSCGRSLEFPGEDMLEEFFQQVERNTGYQVDDHLLQLSGLCPKCQQNR